MDGKVKVKGEVRDVSRKVYTLKDINCFFNVLSSYSFEIITVNDTN